MRQRAEKFYRQLKFLWEGALNTEDESSSAASAFLRALAGEGGGENLPEPFSKGVEIIHKEFDRVAQSDRRKALESLEKYLEDNPIPGVEQLPDFAETLWAVFFPEALYLSPDPQEQISRLKEKRRIKIEHPVEDPIRHPASEMLFTSNVLLSPPITDSRDGVTEGESDEIAEVTRAATAAGNEKQLYWYDHPIAIGTPVENDEAVYGLTGLAEMFAFEKKRGNALSGDRLKVLLSVSVTHGGLHDCALPWLRAQIGRTGKDALKDLDVFAFTEVETEKVIDILTPWLDKSEDVELLRHTFGVDGEYGRHYSFLKALPALWSVLGEPELKATFKIDLDQVFPQKKLVEETGKSAFEHFRSPLWGALGRDSENREIELGMIAGALVNEKDISSGLFTPDIPWPEELPEGENLLFFKQRPMAVSTRAELMTGNSEDETEALQRFHVTGGTNGIRFDALRRHRPFTPTFIGRAEDQGYLLSVLSGSKGKALLRYIHAPGLFMRHDKEAFAGDAVKAGKAGSYVGDLIRLFVFSAYAGFLPGGPGEVKKQVDPFTGCFITPMPATLALLRLALHLLFSRSGRDERAQLLRLAGERLPVWIEEGERKSREMEKEWIGEKRAWDSYYNALNRLEEALAEKDAAALEAGRSFENILKSSRIR